MLTSKVAHNDNYIEIMGIFDFFQKPLLNLVQKPLFSLLKTSLPNKLGEEGKPSGFPPPPSPTPFMNICLFFNRFSLQEETFFFFFFSL
jgi:hypothetical protein